MPSDSDKKNMLVHRGDSVALSVMNYGVLVLSLVMIVWISIDTFEKVDFLNDHKYMRFQFWVCIFFILDFITEILLSKNHWQMFRRRILYLLLSIPYLNIITQLHVHLGADATYFVRFIPLARGVLAMSIVISYMSKNAISSMFLSYINIMVMTAYFCSLIFFQREYGVNPDVTSYWTALWWTCMNLTTVGSAIVPMTISGKIIAVVLPIVGMIMFPLFTVYLTDYVVRFHTQAKGKDSSDPEGANL